MSDQAPAGWYPDGQGGQRWWDGVAWAAPAQEQPGTGLHDAPTQIGGAPVVLPPQQQPAYPQPSWQGPYAGGPGAPKKGVNGVLVGVLGGVAVLVVAAVVLTVVLLGGDDEEAGPDGGGDDGSSSEGEAAAEVAVQYVTAGVLGDYVRFCELIAAGPQAELLESVGASSCEAYGVEVGEQLTGLGPEYSSYREDTEVDVETQAPDVSGEEASVAFELTATYTGEDVEGFEELYGDTVSELAGTVELVLEDGDWKAVEVDTGATPPTVSPPSASAPVPPPPPTP